jgi:hypothetical protein
MTPHPPDLAPLTVAMHDSLPHAFSPRLAHNQKISNRWIREWVAAGAIECLDHNVFPNVYAPPVDLNRAQRLPSLNTNHAGIELAVPHPRQATESTRARQEQDDAAIDGPMDHPVRRSHSHELHRGL